MARASKITAELRRTKAAENLLRQHPSTPAELAPRLGVSASHAATLTYDPAVRAIAAGMLEPHRAALARLVPKAIRVIEQALEAKVGKRNDHVTRLRAVDRLRRMVELVEDYDFRASELPRETATQDSATGEIVFQGTLEDLLIQYRRMTIAGSAKGAD